MRIEMRGKYENNGVYFGKSKVPIQRQAATHVKKGGFFFYLAREILKAEGGRKEESYQQFSLS